MDVENIKLQSDRLIIRPLSYDDLEDFYKISQNKNVAYMSGFKATEDIEEAKVDLDLYMEKKNVLGLTMQGKLVGLVNFHEVDAITNILIPDELRGDLALVVGFLLDESLWSQGIMSEALSEIFSYLKDETPYERLYASHFMDNQRSMAILVKFNFEPSMDLWMVDGYGKRREGLFYTRIL